MTPVAEPPSSAPRKTKSFFIALLVLGVGAFSLSWIMAHTGSSTPVRIQVLKGTSAREISHDLKRNGLILHPWSFLIWVKWHGHKSIRPGIYEFSPRESGLTIYRKMLQGPPTVRVTFPEGWTARQMAALLETRGIVSAQDFLNQVDQQKREGYLFPDTYFFEQGIPADTVLARLVDRFREKVPKDFKEQAKAMKLSYGQLVTLASIVEREAQASQERSLIAGVFYNRLRKHMHLESCATIEFALGARKPKLTYKDLQIDSPYNTYRHAGLPPGPICNPGAASLEAVAHPASTEMMFFVADGKGTHLFSRDYKEHLEVQKKKR